MGGLESRGHAKSGQSWVRAISVPTAALGVVTFFLPWFQVSRGPISLSFSGYEMASGSGFDKLGSEHSDVFAQKLGLKSPHQSPRLKREPQSNDIPERSGHDPVTANRLPLLWAVPLWGSTTFCAARVLRLHLRCPWATVVSPVRSATGTFLLSRSSRSRVPHMHRVVRRGCGMLLRTRLATRGCICWRGSRSWCGVPLPGSGIADVPDLRAPASDCLL